MNPRTVPAAQPARHIAVGSTNRVKVNAVRAVIATLWTDVEVTGIAVASGVPDQPWGDEETLRGAEQRARAALAATSADLAFGIEGGAVLLPDGRVRTCAWAVATDRHGVIGQGGSLAMLVPRRVAALMRNGLELSHAVDAVVGDTDSKHGQGAVGHFTAGLIDRQRAYESLVAYALAPWLAPVLYAE